MRLGGLLLYAKWNWDRMRTRGKQVRKYTHGDLVEIAERWLTKTRRCGFAFSELCAATPNGEIPDCIGFRSGLSILVECKTSRGDFLSDKNKRFRKRPHLGMGNLRFYLAPEGIINKEDLPDGWGLIVVGKKGKPRQLVGPKGDLYLGASGFYHEKKCDDSEMALMYSALRRLHLRKLLSHIYETPDQKVRKRIIGG